MFVVEKGDRYILLKNRRMASSNGCQIMRKGKKILKHLIPPSFKYESNVRG